MHNSSNSKCVMSMNKKNKIMLIQTHTKRNKEVHVCKLRENIEEGAND